MRTQQNFDYTKEKNEEFKGVSMTIPEQTLSLPELIQRYTRGQNVVTYKGQYANLDHDDLDLSKFNRFDPVDRQKIAAAYYSKLKDLQDKYNSGIIVDEKHEQVDVTIDEETINK